MTTEVWQRVQAIFDRVAAVPPGERAAALARECGDDAALRAEVESLLEHDARAGDKYLGTPVPFPGAKANAGAGTDDGAKANAGPGAGDDGAKASAPAGADDRAKAASDWAQRLVGRKIGRYAVERLIGHGGMGWVFEARQERPARTVALKVLPPGLSAPSALARFRMEPEVLGRLRHPNIAQVFEAGVHEDELGAVPYFAMEFIEGARPLLDYAAAQELSTRQRLALFARVCEAVHHGHQKGIIHRDLKPANILVGEDGEPKVIDFGVARASDADITMTKCTHVGDLVGTVRYMSPEQCDGNPAAIDTRSDVYALGVVLYELLTGAAPYETAGTTLYAAIRIIREAPPRPPRELNRRLRGDVEAIVLKALEKEPSRRYASAADLAQDIRRHLAGEPTEARVPTLATRLVRWALRHPLWVTSAACVLMLAVTGAAIWATYWYATNQPYRVTISKNRDMARLETPAGVALAEWVGEGAESIRYVEMVRSGATPSGGPLVIIGHTEGHASSRAPRGCFAFYDVNRDSTKPFRELRLEPNDIPVDEIRRRRGDDGYEFTADTFRAQIGLLADVFPEDAGPPTDELIAVFQHGATTHAAIRVYRLNGDLVYQVWVEAHVSGLYWMTKSRLLVIAGRNGEAPLDAREVENPPKNTVHPCVVFAIRPQYGQITTRYIAQEPDDRTAAPAELRPAWYYCVIPEEWHWATWFSLYEPGPLRRPPATIDPGDAVSVQIECIAAGESTTRRDDRVPGPGWIIRANGEIGDFPAGDSRKLYERRRTSPNVLPPFDSWRLGELPPRKPHATTGPATRNSDP